MGIKITNTCKSTDYEKVSPNFIYNRYDLFCKNSEFNAVKLYGNVQTKIIEYRVTETEAELGLWLMPITTDELEHLLYYIKRMHPKVEKVTYKNALLPYGNSKAHNHFRIVLPDTVEEMESRVSARSRYKMRKKLRFAEEAYGPMRIMEYDRGNMPPEIVEAFFEFKLATRNRTYNMTPLEYLDRYHVSHCYVVQFGDTIGAIRFSCEQCPIVYGENFTFNPALQEYSLGRFIFMHHLLRIVEKNHTELYFAGGNYEYKTHYGSIEETLYDCVIDVSQMDFSKFEQEEKLSWQIKHWMIQHLPPKVVYVLKKILKTVKR